MCELGLDVTAFNLANRVDDGTVGGCALKVELGLLVACSCCVVSVCGGELVLIILLEAFVRKFAF